MSESIDTRPDPFNKGMSLPEGHLTFEDESILYKYSKGVCLAVEIGTFKGRAAVLMSYNAKRVVTIDSYPEKRTAQDPEMSYSRINESLKGYLYITVVEGVSWLTPGLFPHESIGLLFLDGDHSYEGVIKDFKAFFPKVKKGGTIIFHDYKYMIGRVSEKAVKPAVDSIVENFNVTDLETTGWCKVVRKN